MSAVSWAGLLFALTVSLSGWRLAYPIRELATVSAAICLVWIGLGEDGWLMFFGLLLPFTLLGWKIPPILDTGGWYRGRRYPGEATAFSESARVVDGLLASRWTNGELRLESDRLAFVAADSRIVFDIEVNRIQQVARVAVGRADIVVETLAADYPIAFGRKRLGGVQIIAGQHFWSRTLGRLADREL